MKLFTNEALLEAINRLDASKDRDRYIIVHPLVYKELYLYINAWVLTRKKWLRNKRK